MCVRDSLHRQIHVFRHLTSLHVDKIKSKEEENNETGETLQAHPIYIYKPLSLQYESMDNEAHIK